MRTVLRPDSYDRTMILMLGCGAFLAGLVMARFSSLTDGLFCLLSVACAGLLIKYRNLLAVVAVICAGLAVGMWRGTAYLDALSPYHALALEQVTFIGTVNVDAVYGKKSQLSFTVRDVRFSSPVHVHPPGTIKVNGFGEVMVYRGDQVRVTGHLYPTRGASQATVSFAQLHKTGGQTTVVDDLRRKFVAGMQSVLPEPLGSFGLGLLVGQRNTLPDELTEALLMVGLTHIIAVSGYNLTILLDTARRLLGSRSKVLSTAVALSLIVVFLLIAGTSASITRASVIAILSLAAWYYGRSIRPVLLILMAAAGTAYACPTYLWSDIGWYLSFLAFFGILVLGPLVTRLFYHERKPPLLAAIAVESLCAEIMTVPLVLYIFGQFSLVSLLANMLIVALIPLAMLLCFIAGLAGMLVGNVAGWLAWPAMVLLTYMLDIVRILSNIPHIFQRNHYLSAADMTICYGGLTLVLTLAYGKQLQRSRFNYAANSKRTIKQ